MELPKIQNFNIESHLYKTHITKGLAVGSKRPAGLFWRIFTKYHFSFNASYSPPSFSLVSNTTSLELAAQVVTKGSNYVQPCG
jgi:hypothetical protein